MKKNRLLVLVFLILALFICFGNINVKARQVEGFTTAETSGKSRKVSCGNVTGIPRKIPELTSYSVTVIQIAVPVILVVMGSLDLFKGVTAQKEDEIKKMQQLFIKRLIVAGSIFFVIVIAKLLISVVAESSSANIVECVDCFLSNSCK